MDFLYDLFNSPIGAMAVNLGTGLIMKHGIRKLPNNSIPFINGALTAGGAMIFGGVEAAEAVKFGLMVGTVGATGAHQTAKLIGKFATNGVNKALGGERRAPSI